MQYNISKDTIVDNPSWQTKIDKITFSMFLAMQGIIPSKEFQHDPYLINSHKQTVAILLAINKIIPPKQWKHNALLQDDSDNSVALILSYHGIIPPSYWMHNINFKNKQKQSIISNLKKNGYLYINRKFTKLQESNINKIVKVQIKNDICQICYNDEQQQLIKTNCGHIICSQCFLYIIQSNINSSCPVCRRQDWYNVTQKQYQSFLKNIHIQ